MFFLSNTDDVRKQMSARLTLDANSNTRSAIKASKSDGNYHLKFLT